MKLLIRLLPVGLAVLLMAAISEAQSVEGGFRGGGGGFRAGASMSHGNPVRPGIYPGYRPGIYPGYRPGYHPGYRPGYHPGYRPGYRHRFGGFHNRLVVISPFVG